MTYSQKLRDPRWQKKRLEIFQRDDFKCVICKSGTKNLQVHHVVYRKLEPWEYPDYCYQTLCEDCHEERQELTDKAVDALRMQIKDFPTDRLETVAGRLMTEAISVMEVGK